MVKRDLPEVFTTKKYLEILNQNWCALMLAIKKSAILTILNSSNSRLDIEKFSKIFGLFDKNDRYSLTIIS